MARCIQTFSSGEIAIQIMASIGEVIIIAIRIEAISQLRLAPYNVLVNLFCFIYWPGILVVSGIDFDFYFSSLTNFFDVIFIWFANQH